MYLLTLLLIGGAVCKPYDGYYCMPCQAPYPCQNYNEQGYYTQQPLYLMKSDSPQMKEEPEIPPDMPSDPVPRRKKTRVLTSIFSIPGALADSFLSGEISV